MTTAGTRTGSATYTDVDVANVLACFGAEYDMIRSTTGLHQDDAWAGKHTHDIEQLALYGLIAKIDVTLHNRFGAELRAHVYMPSTSAGMWKAQRPGGCIWPRTMDGTLTVTVSYSPAYSALTRVQKQVLGRLLRLPWSPSSADLSHRGLAAGASRTFASAGYGVERATWQ